MGFLSKLLGELSGSAGLKVSEQLLFDKVIGFKGLVPGCGTSTIVQNVAVALSETTNLDICVLDTNFLYPTQYPLLVNTDDEKRKDFLNYAGDLSTITVPTNCRNTYLISLNDRGIVDMLSSKDSEDVLDKVIGALKTSFDVILIDLSYELTNINTHAAIKCNRIINVADQSIKLTYNLRKSLNTMATLAIPMAKANRVIINKVLPDVVTNTKSVFEQADMKVLGEIPFSMEIAKAGVSGKKIWTTFSSNYDIAKFSDVIDTLIDEVIQKTPLNGKYFTKADVLDETKDKVEELDEIETETVVESVVIEDDMIEDDIIEDVTNEEQKE